MQRLRSKPFHEGGVQHLGTQVNRAGVGGTSGTADLVAVKRAEDTWPACAVTYVSGPYLPARLRKELLTVVEVPYSDSDRKCPLGAA